MASADSNLRVRLREAGEAELLDLVTEHAADLDAGAAQQVLRNPYVTRQVVEVLLQQRRLLTSQDLRRELVAHRATPEARALNLVPTLGWRDLVAIGANTRVQPRLRRAADLRLSERITQLSSGERMAIARRAGPGVISRLRHDGDPTVIGALLENPRLTEGLLMPLLSSDTASPRALARVADDCRWGVRYGVRVALARNPRTPVEKALGLLSGLKKKDLHAVAVDWRIAAPVRKRAELLGGGGAGSRRGI